MDIERVLLIFMVIVLHYNNRAMGGALNYAMTGDSREFFTRFTESLCICAVDAFLMLSGYFAVSREHIRVPYKKALWLLAVCSFYRVIGYLIYAFAVTHDFSVRTLVAYIIPSNWFVVMFVTILLLSPFIIRLLDRLDERALRELIIILTVLFSIVPTVTLLGGDLAGVDLSGFATITINGDMDGFNITSFLLCYCLGFFIRRQKNMFDKIPGWIYPIMYLAIAAVMSLISYRSEKVWSYSGILCVAEALTLTLAFARVKAGRADNKSLNAGTVFAAVGGCSLGIFIWHTMPLMIYGYWVHLDIASISQKSPGGYIANFFAATLSMYALSLVWVLACRSVVALVKKSRRKADI